MLILFVDMLLIGLLHYESLRAPPLPDFHLFLFGAPLVCRPGDLLNTEDMLN